MELRYNQWQKCEQCDFLESTNADLTTHIYIPTQSIGRVLIQPISMVFLTSRMNIECEQCDRLLSTNVELVRHVCISYSMNKKIGRIFNVEVSFVLFDILKRRNEKYPKVKNKSFFPLIGALPQHQPSIQNWESNCPKMHKNRSKSVLNDKISYLIGRKAI